MEEDKNIFGTIMFDILAMAITLLLSTVNVLYFIFMLASCVLVLNAYKDIKKYNTSTQKKSKHTNIITILAILSLCSLVLVILLGALKRTEFAYAVYGIEGPIFLGTAIYTINDYLKNKKLKSQVVIEDKNEEKIDFVVKDMGTSIDRENAKEEENLSKEVDTTKSFTNNESKNDN